VKQFDLALPPLRERFDVVRHALEPGSHGAHAAWAVMNQTNPRVLHTLGAEAFRVARAWGLNALRPGGRRLPRWLAAGAAAVEPWLGLAPGLVATFAQSAHECDWAARLVTAPIQFTAKVAVRGPLAPRVVPDATCGASGPRTILACGGFDAVANLKHLVWAFDVIKYPHPDLKLVILGDGPQRADIERFAHHLGGDDVRVKCVGHQADITSFLADAMLAWGSHTRGGTKFLLEAMAAGVPVIATDTPDARAVLTPGASGELVPVDRPVEMAKVAHRLLTDPDRWRARSLAGQPAATRYPVADLAEALAGVYDTLTSSASPRLE
jgi:glycosyltransferase involved in cell wall biosynthesis